MVYESHPEGIVEVKFDDPKNARDCIELMNGRCFNCRILECFYYDGKTNYRIVRDTSKEIEQKRIDDFGKWLEGQTSDIVKEYEDIGSHKKEFAPEGVVAETVDQDADTDPEDNNE